MWRIRRVLLRLLNVVRPSAMEPELAKEIASHLALLEEEFARRGMSPDQARLAARRALGGVEQVKERHRDERSLRWADDAKRDVHYAVRMLGRNPGFAVVAILTLALGIGANTAIFSVVHSLLLKPLPYKDSDRLVRLVATVPAAQSPTAQPQRSGRISVAELVELRSRSRLLTQSAFTGGPVFMTLRGRGESSRLQGQRVSPGVFATLGEQALFGRVFGAPEEAPGAASVIIFSYTRVAAALWRRRGPRGSGRRALEQPRPELADRHPRLHSRRDHAEGLRVPRRTGTVLAADGLDAVERGFNARTARAGRIASGRRRRSRRHPPRAPTRSAARHVRARSHARHDSRTRQTCPRRALDSGGVRPADRVRQRRQSSTRACIRPPARDGHTRRAWRRPRPGDSPASYRESASRRAGRRRGERRGVRRRLVDAHTRDDLRPHRPWGPAAVSEAGGNRHRRVRSVVRHCDVRADWRLVRAGASVRPVAPRSRGGHHGSHTRSNRLWWRRRAHLCVGC